MSRKGKKRKEERKGKEGWKCDGCEVGKMKIVDMEIEIRKMAEDRKKRGEERRNKKAVSSQD